jgi:cation:H+ antiporter
MLVTLLLFFLSAALIYWACEYFVNGVEWCGTHLRLGAMAVGAVLAAFGTALPESSVTFFAVVFGKNAAEKDLGVGAALGGPLVLSTLAYAVVGVALLANRRGQRDRTVAVDHKSLSRDQLLFLLIFCANILLGISTFPLKHLCGAVFVAAYALYVLFKMKDRGAATAEEPEPLRLGRSASLGWAVAQTLLALAVIAFASHLFVQQLGAIGMALHWPPQMTALLLSPVATELPETMNALIWVRQGKERLALANISGAMMIQATIPSALGLFFTAWRFDRTLLISSLITAAAIGFLWLLFRRGQTDARTLAAVCAFYALFAALTVWNFNQRWQRIPAADRARLNPLSNTPQTIAEGRMLYAAHCQQCHQSNAQGSGHVPSLHSARLRQASEGQIEWFLRQGVSNEGMPSWGGLREEQRWAIVRYLKSVQTE